MYQLSTLKNLKELYSQPFYLVGGAMPNASQSGGTAKILRLPLGKRRANSSRAHGT